MDLTSKENITTLRPATVIFASNTSCSGMFPMDLTKLNCTVWQDCRMFLIQTYEHNNPTLNDDIETYRLKLINTALQSLPSNLSHTFLRESAEQAQWRIIGLSQRSDYRQWLNINEILAYCNTQFYEKRIVCVEVDVANLPTNFTSVGINQQLSEVDEQFVLYRSINALIGIHGSQLTQGVLMPTGSITMELFQWFPKNWNYTLWGDGWTNSKTSPTPMGILWHNTDINEVSFSLERDSVPLCQNMSDNIFVNVPMNDGIYNASELQYCLETNDNLWRWDRRNFNVRLDIIDTFVDVFFYHRFNTSASVIPFCDDLRQRGERNDFVLYNVVCKDGDGSISPHHYYLQ